MEKQNGAGKGLGSLTLEVSFLRILIFLMPLLREQAKLAIEEADLILLMIDGGEDTTSGDVPCSVCA